MRLRFDDALNTGGAHRVSDVFVGVA